jgi:hypothetical protein
MESFVRRLKYYGIGFGLGLVFVFFFFQNRGCTWTPSNRVKNTVLDRLIVVSDETKVKMDEKGISSDDIINVLNDGNVDFSISDKDKKDKVYLIEKEGVNYVFTLPYESFVSEVFLSDKAKGIKSSTSGMGTIIHFPNDKNMVFSDTISVVTCQQEKLSMISDKKIFEAMEKTGKIDFEKTDFSIRPKPEHHIVFKFKDKEIGATAIWYKSKLYVNSYHHPSVEDCQ